MARAEWILTDGRGAFSMGTPEGVRFRKYHGFYLNIPGRGESASLLDLEIEANGIALWPHLYQGDHALVTHPDLTKAAVKTTFVRASRGPEWTFELPNGVLTFSVSTESSRAGIDLEWSWQAASSQEECALIVRPFFAFRDLHALGGMSWTWESRHGAGKSDEARIVSESGEGRPARELYARLSPGFRFEADARWYRAFAYPEEANRGYDSREDLFSAGRLEARLAGRSTARISLTEHSESLLEAPGRSRAKSRARASRYQPLLDFVLREPAGIVAGFPWFGEWGRDTFIALPGIATGWLRAGGDADEVWAWVRELLLRWGEWIPKRGMLPNLIYSQGEPQWESADATLWWTHAVASLWAASLTKPFAFAAVQEACAGLLNAAIDQIRAGKHDFLIVDEAGLLQVTEPHTTWMDARVDGHAVSPRIGRLPEINALWFQALALRELWSEAPDFTATEAIGRKILEPEAFSSERDRPNLVFLHSLPLAPSFVLGDVAARDRDLRHLRERLWTPVGLRTLDPASSQYRGRCEGDQPSRDRAYHQGTVWPWLGGHYAMAEARTNRAATAVEPTENAPIAGHIPEIFDGDAPHEPRGAPAQAWSLACYEEARNRSRNRADAKLTQVLAERWLGRRNREAVRRTRSASRPSTRVRTKDL